MVDGVLWHERLSHSYQAILDQILRGMNLSIQPSMCHHMCAPYQMEKAHQLPLISVYSRSLLPFDIVHGNIWGLSHALSSNDVCYFLLFIDNFIRYMWLFVMHNTW